jgi:predicted nucleotidyltransferase
VVAPAVPYSAEAVTAFCAKYGIAELSLFGSVLRGDFQHDSDVDVLVVFKPDSDGMTFENLPDMLDELRAIFGGRRIDLVERRMITNPFKRHHILTNRRVIHAA